MLKSIILATSMLVAVPAFAQDAKPIETAPAQEQTAPVTQEAAPVTDDAAPAQTAETATAATPQTTPAPTEPAQPATAAAQPAPTTQPAASQDQVAQAVGAQWGSYDKDGDSKLSKAEFGAWMTGLRSAAEPNFKPGTPEAATWEAQAFASADADKSASVNKQELTAFLTPKAS